MKRVSLNQVIHHSFTLLIWFWLRTLHLIVAFTHITMLNENEYYSFVICCYCNCFSRLLTFVLSCLATSHTWMLITLLLRAIDNETQNFQNVIHRFRMKQIAIQCLLKFYMKSHFQYQFHVISVKSVLAVFDDLVKKP